MSKGANGFSGRKKPHTAASIKESEAAHNWCDICAYSKYNNSTGGNCNDFRYSYGYPIGMCNSSNSSNKGSHFKMINQPKEKEMNYIMLDGKEMPMSDETAESFRKATEKTYKAGDWFKGEMSGDYYLLIMCGENLKIVDVTYGWGPITTIRKNPTIKDILLDAQMRLIPCKSPLL